MKLQHSDFSFLLDRYSDFKVSELKGRYIKESDLLSVFKTLSHKFKIKNEGYSEEGRIISSFRFGSGPRKILIWSQMHGNESTTTKSVLDLMNLLEHDKKLNHFLLNNCSFAIVPVLNPDGAARYTRVNANGIDLNRDALEQTQAESKILQSIYSDFKPDLCFNMHDQRTIFSAGYHDTPATVSFLSPSYNEARDINKVRSVAMSLIADANAVLQNFIPGQVGRYDDGFNMNCVGDYFQKKGTPTILFEAGHFPKDYEREETRKYIFLALLQMLIQIANDAELNSEKLYFEIPENKKLFYDVVLRHVNFDRESLDVAVQFKEVLNENSITFKPIIEKIGRFEQIYGHREIDLKNQFISPDHLKKLTVGSTLSSLKVNDNVFVM